MIFETVNYWLKNWVLLYFNPRFLSMAFETWDNTHESRARRSFQSSFSEYDLWNTFMISLLYHTESISILVFWVWPLKHVHDFPPLSYWIDFNPRFLSMAFETHFNSGLPSISSLYFNPRFLSMTFETNGTSSWVCRLLAISILVFWVWPLKQSQIGDGLFW